MFGRIIVATDLTANTSNSLAAACDLCHSQGSVMLVHVVRRIAHILDAELRDVYDRLKADAGKRMLELKAGFTRERRVDILCTTAIGSPAQEIARIAKEWDADLIVLAHDAADDPATLGSVSYSVSHLAPCAVLMLKTLQRVKTAGRRRTRTARPVPRAKRTPPPSREGRRVG
jgi:nucleotide-binding universal stress UspA family protein